MSDLINIINNRKLLASIRGFECSPEYIFEHIGVYGWTLEQIKQQMEK